MNQYTYDGPVMNFGTCISDQWHGTTYAVSEKKARSNLAYQFITGSRITLPGKVKMVNKYDY